MLWAVVESAILVVVTVVVLLLAFFPVPGDFCRHHCHQHVVPESAEHV